MAYHRIFLGRTTHTPKQGIGGGDFVCGNGERRQINDGSQFSWNSKVTCEACLLLKPSEIKISEFTGKVPRCNLANLKVGEERRWPFSPEGSHSWLVKLGRIGASIKKQEVDYRRKFSLKLLGHNLVIKRLS